MDFQRTVQGEELNTQLIKHGIAVVEAIVVIVSLVYDRSQEELLNEDAGEHRTECRADHVLCGDSRHRRELRRRMKMREGMKRNDGSAHC